MKLLLYSTIFFVFLVYVPLSFADAAVTSKASKAGASVTVERLSAAGSDKKGLPSPPVRFQNFDSGEEVELVIGKGINDEGNILSYRAELYSDRDLKWMIRSVSGLENMEGGVAWTLGKLSEGLYFWRIKVSDGTYESGWSSIGAFRVGKQPSGKGNTDKAFGKRRY